VGREFYTIFYKAGLADTRLKFTLSDQIQGTSKIFPQRDSCIFQDPMQLSAAYFQMGAAYFPPDAEEPFDQLGGGYIPSKEEDPIDIRNMPQGRKSILRFCFYLCTKMKLMDIYPN